MAWVAAAGEGGVMMPSTWEESRRRELADLEAERVTHTGESHQELVRRLQGERPLSPYQLRLERERLKRRVKGTAA